jgi:hypothetical protein
MGNKINQDKTENKDFQTWLEELDTKGLNLWREVMTEMRHRANEMWLGVRFFITLNGIIIAAIITFLRDNNSTVALFIILFGIIFYIIEFFRLKIHRYNFLDVVMRRALIEDRLGFYDAEIHSSIKLAFEPSSVPAEDLAELKSDAEQWKKKRIFGQTKWSATHLLWLHYYLIGVVYLGLLVYVIKTLIGANDEQPLIFIII